MRPFVTRVRCIRACAAIVALLSWALPAAAQTDSAAARALFGEGRTLMEAERYAEACPKFEESLRLDHGMGTQFNLAHCWEKMGRTASAWAMFLDVAAAARAGNQPDRERAARERASALEQKLTRLEIVVTDPAANTEVTRDDQAVGPAAWGTAMPVDPGDHVIRVTAPGKRAWSQKVNVPADSKLISVTVPALEDAPTTSDGDEAKEQVAPTETALQDSGQRDAGSSGQKLASYIIGGVGLAAVATGTVFMIQSRQDDSEARKLCNIVQDGRDTCVDDDEKDRHDALVEDAKREQLIALIGFGVGGAALVTATVLYLNADATEKSQEAAFAITPVLGIGGFGASVSGHF